MEKSPPKGSNFATRIGRRRFLLILAVLCLILIGLRVFLAEKVPASALFADDYLYLQLGGLISSGEFGALKQEIRAGAGILYPLFVSGWVAFDDLDTRFRFVFLLNTLLYATFVFFGADAIAKLTRQGSFILAIMLATIPSVFVMGYYVLAENLIFPLLAIAAWLIADGEKALRGWRLGVLCTLAAVAPLVRPPGFAISVGIVAAMLPYASAVGRRFLLARASFVLANAIFPYLVLMLWLEGIREGSYLERLETTLFELGRWYTPVTLTVGQFPYILFAAGLWGLPLFLLFVSRSVSTTEDQEVRRPIAAFASFVGVTATGFLGFAIIHLLARQAIRGDGPFYFIGRYLDPAAVLMVLGGGVGLLLLGRRRPRQATVVATIMVATTISLYAVLSDTGFRPSVYTGLSIFSAKVDYFTTAILGTLFAGLPWLWLGGRKPGGYAAVLLLLGWVSYNAATLRPSMEYTMKRSSKVRHSLEAAAWLLESAPPGSSVCLDWRVRGQKSPGGIKTMGHVFLAMEFAAFPLEVRKSRNQTVDCNCDFFLTLEAQAIPSVDLNEGFQAEQGNSQVWTNGDTAIYEVASCEPFSKVAEVGPKRRGSRGSPEVSSTVSRVDARASRIPGRSSELSEFGVRDLHALTRQAFDS